MCVFAGRDADTVRLQTATNGSVAKDVVGGGGLFDEPGKRRLVGERTIDGKEADEPWLDLLETLDVVDGLLNVPDLVSVDHEHCTSRSSVLPTDGLVIGRAVYAAMRECFRIDKRKKSVLL